MPLSTMEGVVKRYRDNGGAEWRSPVVTLEVRKYWFADLIDREVDVYLNGRLPFMPQEGESLSLETWRDGHTGKIYGAVGLTIRALGERNADGQAPQAGPEDRKV